MWSIVNSQLKGSSGLKTTQLTFSINGSPTSDSKKIADALNTYFLNIPNVLNLPPANDNYNPDSSSSASVFLAPFSDNEINLLLKKLKNNLSSGVDDIPNMLIKNCDFLLKPFCHLINISFSNGVFPSVLKLAKTIPVFKKGVKSDMANYRPISILPTFSKLFEFAFCKRLNSFLHKNNLICSAQNGFCKNKCTEDGIHALIQLISESLNEKKIRVSRFFRSKQGI